MPRLRNPDGQDNVKLRVRARDGYRCTKCGLTNEQHRQRYGKQLQVHRVRPGSRYTLDGCVTLCNPCHGPEPKRQRGQPDEAGKTTVQFRPPEALLERLRALAKKDKRSVAKLVELLLEEALAAREAKGGA